MPRADAKEIPAISMACPLLRRVTFVKSEATCCAPHAFHQPKTHRLWLVFLGCHGKSHQKRPWKPRFPPFLARLCPSNDGACLHRESECGHFGAKTGIAPASNSLSRLPCTTVELLAPTFLSGVAAKREAESVQHFHHGKMIFQFAWLKSGLFFTPKPREEVKEP